MNPDDLAAIARRVAVARQAGGVPGFVSETTSTANAILPTDKLTKVRAAVLKARAAGYPDSEINQLLAKKYGTRLDLVMQPNQADALRAAAAGATFGFNDELAGLIGKLTGNGYTATRDAVRANEQAARAVAPKRMLASELLGAGGAGLLTAGLGAASDLGAGGRALQAAKIGGLAGGASGLGHSEAPDLRGQLTDAAKSALLGSILGTALSGAGSAINAARGGAARTVAGEARAVLPGDAAATVARQEELAPGTAVLADRNPDMVRFARGVGADRETARLARDEADQRVAALNTARKQIGRQYNQIDQSLPVDNDLRKLVGGRLMLPGDEVKFSAVHDLRSDIARKLRAAEKAYQVTGEKGDVIAELQPVKAGLDAWLQARVPGLAQLDSDYGFVVGRLLDARKLRKQIGSSLAGHASAKAAGYSAVSPAAQLTRNPSVTDFVSRLLSPNRGARAKLLRDLLMTPGGAQRVLSATAPQPSVINRGLLFGLGDLAGR